MQNSEFRIQTERATKDGVEFAAIFIQCLLRGPLCILHFAF